MPSYIPSQETSDRRGHARAPERRRGNAHVARHGDLEVTLRLGGLLRARLELGRLGLELERLALDALDQRRRLGGIDQCVDRVESLERVLAVVDARLVEHLAVDQRRAPAEVAVDGRAADQHRITQTRAVQLATQIGICLLVDTSSAESPIAVAFTSWAFSRILVTGTCLPRSCTV